MWAFFSCCTGRTSVILKSFPFFSVRWILTWSFFFFFTKSRFSLFSKAEFDFLWLLLVILKTLTFNSRSLSSAALFLLLRQQLISIISAIIWLMVSPAGITISAVIRMALILFQVIIVVVIHLRAWSSGFIRKENARLSVKEAAAGYSFSSCAGTIGSEIFCRKSSPRFERKYKNRSGKRAG